MVRTVAKIRRASDQEARDGVRDCTKVTGKRGKERGQDVSVGDWLRQMVEMSSMKSHTIAFRIVRAMPTCMVGASWGGMASEGKGG